MNMCRTRIWHEATMFPRQKQCKPTVASKRQSSVNSGAWLRRFDDVTRVEKSCVAKGINKKKSKGKISYYYK